MRKRLKQAIQLLTPGLFLLFTTITVQGQKFELQNDMSCTTMEQSVSIFPFDNDLIDIPSIDFSTFKIVDGPIEGTAIWDPFTYVLSYTPNSGILGADQIVYEVCNHVGECKSATIEINVQAASIIPLVDVFTFDGVSFSGNVLRNDVISTLTNNNFDVILISGPSDGSVDLETNGDFVYTQNAGYLGKDYFVYQVCDLTNNICEESTVALNVIQLPTDPENYTLINDFGLTFTSNTSFVNYLLSRHNVIVNTAELPVNYTLVADAQYGNLIFNSNGTFSYITSSNFTGKDEFSYEVCVGDDCTESRVFVDVLDENIACRRHFPNALNNTIGVCNIEELNGNFKYNDLFYGYYDDTKITILDGPDHGVMTYDQAGNFTYLPDLEYVGIDRIEYEICEEDLSVMEYPFTEMNENMNVPFGMGTDVLEESIYITDPGVLSDLEIYVQIKHSSFEEVNVNLIHPNGTIIPLVNNLCTGAVNLDLMFSDASTIAVDCNLTTNQTVAPISPLADVLSTQIQGEWTLQIIDNSDNSNQGVLTAWGMESVLKSSISRDCRKAWIEIPVIDKNQISLDLELLEFKAQKFGKNSVELNWTTNEYGAARYYNIQRSSENSPEWATIGTSLAKNTLSASYNYSDENLESAKYYYRLQKHENNGEVFNSEIRVVEISTDNSRGLISNITEQSLIYSDLGEANVTIEIFDTAGKRMLQRTGNGTVHFDVQSLPAGMYVSVVTSGKVYYSEKFIKK